MYVNCQGALVIENMTGVLLFQGTGSVQRETKIGATGQTAEI